MNVRPALTILGKPGAGKGTVSKFLKDKLALSVLSPGDRFRQIAKSDTPGEIKKLLNEGALVPEEMVLDLTRSWLSEEQFAQGVILDGLPRTENQCHALEKLLVELGFTVVPALFIDISDGDILARLEHRRVCNHCGAIWNLLTRPPANAHICDRCDGALVARDDDHPEIVAKRLQVFRDQYTPVLEYFGNRNMLKTLHCTRQMSADDLCASALSLVG